MQPAATAPTCLLIADISGYTEYLGGVELDHAHDILADLMGSIVSALRPTFRLAKLEGDAAFMSMPVDQPDGTLLLDTIERCYVTFRRRRRDVRQATSCPCDACMRIPELDLKFVVHHGVVVTQKVAGRQELVGSDVILVHRLLKNTVVEELDVPAYALFTEACTTAAGLDPVALGMVTVTETIDGFGEVRCHVLDLERRWQEEEERARVRVEPADSVMTFALPTSVPPAIAWSVMTSPGHRLHWQAGITAFEVSGAVGGRRGMGSTNHCAHGDTVILEEILDWRPFDYITDRTSLPTPDGVIRLLHMVEFEPTATGTTIHVRFAAPRTKRERAAIEPLLPMFEEVVRASLRGLAERFEAMDVSVDPVDDPEQGTGVS